MRPRLTELNFPICLSATTLGTGALFEVGGAEGPVGQGELERLSLRIRSLEPQADLLGARREDLAVLTSPR